MAKIRIVYASVTGNTESIAEMLQEHMSGKGHDVDCANAENVEAKALGTGFDCVLLATSVWGTDTIELPNDFAAYEDAFSEMDLTGKKCAAFASGDSGFELYCAGVDFIEEQYKAVNAEILLDGLRVDGAAPENKDQIIAWADELLSKL